MALFWWRQSEALAWRRTLQRGCQRDVIITRPSVQPVFLRELGLGLVRRRFRPAATQTPQTQPETHKKWRSKSSTTTCFFPTTMSKWHRTAAQRTANGLHTFYITKMHVVHWNVLTARSVDYPKSEYCCWKDTLLLSVSCVFYYYVSTASEILTLLEWWQVSKDLKTEIKKIIQFDTQSSEKNCADRPFNETCSELWALYVTMNLKPPWIKC